MTTPTSATTEPIYSTLGTDQELREIVELFVEEMPDRASALLDRAEARDWEGLRRVAHQLKGAAGSYGFEPITAAAASVEDVVRDSHSEDEIRRVVRELVALCGRARARPPE